MILQSILIFGFIRKFFFYFNKEGLWLINKYEKECDPELYETIIGMELQRRRLMTEPQNTYTQQQIAYLTRTANLLRSKSLYYQERSIFDNIAIVGTDYVKRCERTMPALAFRTSILCKRIDKVEGMFYESFEKKVHTYHATDNSRLNDYKEQKYNCLLDTDIVRTKPIAISFFKPPPPPVR